MLRSRYLVAQQGNQVRPGLAMIAIKAPGCFHSIDRDGGAFGLCLRELSGIFEFLKSRSFSQVDAMNYSKFDDEVPAAVKRQIAAHERAHALIDRYENWHVISWFVVALGIAMLLGAEAFGGHYRGVGAVIAIGSGIWQLQLRKGSRIGSSDQQRIEADIERLGWRYGRFPPTLEKKVRETGRKSQSTHL